MTSPKSLRSRIAGGTVVVAGFVVMAALVADRNGLTTVVTLVTEPEPAVVTAPVERRVLEDTVVTRGTIAMTDVVSIPLPSLDAARPVVTSIAVAPGGQVDEGQKVASVSGRPVIVLEGAFPMFRDISPGIEGEDVAQLQESLTRLGLYEGKIDGTFGWATQRAVRDLYLQNSSEPLRTIAAVSPEGSIEVSGLAQPTAAGGIRIPLDEIVFVPELPAAVIATHVSIGDIPESGTSILDLSAGELRVKTVIPARRIDAIEMGTRGTIFDELTGDTFEAEVVAIAAEPQPGSDVLEHEVQLRPLGSAVGPLGANVRVTFSLAATKGSVLVVPITAVWTGGAHTFITVAENGEYRDVTVETGLSVGGWVEIVDSDEPLEEGTPVVVTR